MNFLIQKRLAGCRRFDTFAERRKQKRNLKESQAPSMMNLLDEDEDDEEDDTAFQTGEQNTVSEPYNFSSNTQNTTTTSTSWSSSQSRQHFDIV